LGLDSPIPKSFGAEEFRRYDIIHIHDLPEFNWAHLPWLSRQAPLIWTVHSMQPLTGNCLYSYGCERFLQNCGTCPQFGQWPLNWLHRDGSYLNMRLKRTLMSQMTMQVVGVSDWISEQARKSLFGSFPVTTIKNAIDPECFFPIDRNAAREQLQIPQNAKTVMLSVASNVLDQRKGLDLALAALPRLVGLNLFLLPTGISGDTSALKKAMAGIAGLEPRNITDDALMRDYYAAADVVWHPSRADNYPMVLLEAIACGTPVIAAAVGGVPEIVNENNGILIPANDSEALAQTTRNFFEGVCVQNQHKNERSALVTSNQFMRFIDEHEVLYKKLIS